MPIDVITVNNASRTKQLLEQVGGIAIWRNFRCRSERANLSYYLDIVQEKIPAAENDSTCTDVVGRVLITKARWTR